MFTFRASLRIIADKTNRAKNFIPKRTISKQRACEIMLLPSTPFPNMVHSNQRCSDDKN